MKKYLCKEKMQCPVCLSSSYTLRKDCSEILGLKSPYCILECHVCGLKRLDPQLTESELTDLYSDAYFAHSDKSNLKLQDIISTTQYELDVKSRYWKFEETLRNIRRHNPSLNDFLDVGAATGDMVNIANNNGFNADGIEMSVFAIDEAKAKYGVNLMNKYLCDLDDCSYEILHLNHVFEHFNSPLVEVKHLNRVLKEKGVLYLEIPFQFNLIELVLFKFLGRKKPFTLHSIHHPFFYTPKTIKKILESNGFSILSVNIFSFRRLSHQRGFNFKHFFWYILSFFGIGNFIEVYAMKSSRKL
jgi:SAM-dependent methyltransferase